MPRFTRSSFRSRCLNLSNQGLLFHLSAFQTIYDARLYGQGCVFRLLRSLPRDRAPVPSEGALEDFGAQGRFDGARRLAGVSLLRVVFLLQVF